MASLMSVNPFRSRPPWNFSTKLIATSSICHVEVGALACLRLVTSTLMIDFKLNFGKLTSFALEVFVMNYSFYLQNQVVLNSYMASVYH